MHQQQGKDSVRLLLSESVNKKPRITNNQRIYQAACDELDKINYVSDELN